MADKTIADFQTTSPSNGDLVLLSTGGVTMNTTVQQLRGMVAVTINNLSSLPHSVENAAITSNMVVFGQYLSNPRAQTSDWTVTTSTGSVEITGSINGTTSLTLYLGWF